MTPRRPWWERESPILGLEWSVVLICIAFLAIVIAVGGTINP